MASIYDFSFSKFWKDNLPPDKRNENMLSWGTVLMKPLQWLRDLLFYDYADGFTGDKWNSSDTYTKGKRVRYIDHSVYEALDNVSANVPPPTDTTLWLKIQNIWVGVRPRTKYTGQKLSLEWVLNEWFDTVFRQPNSNVSSPNYYLPKSDIFIIDNTLSNFVFIVGGNESNSSIVYRSESRAEDFVINAYDFNEFDFTINIPAIVWTALGTSPEERDAAVKAIANKYVIAGIKYNINPY